MKKTYRIYEIIAIIAMVINAIASIVLLPKLPEEIPINLDMNWNPSYGSKYYTLLFASLPIILYYITIIFPSISNKMRKKNVENKNYDLLIMITTLFLCMMNGVSILYVFNNSIEMRKIILIVVGLLILVMGNYIPTIRCNHLLGIRNPWTLRNEYVWKKTHRIGGHILALIGIVYILMGVIDSGVFNSLGIMITTIGIIGINVYSLLIYMKDKK